MVSYWRSYVYHVMFRPSSLLIGLFFTTKAYPAVIYWRSAAEALNGTSLSHLPLLLHLITLTMFNPSLKLFLSKCHLIETENINSKSLFWPFAQLDHFLSKKFVIIFELIFKVTMFQNWKCLMLWLVKQNLSVRC